MSRSIRVQNYDGGLFGGENCCCSFTNLTILILIVLQFSGHNDSENDDEECERNQSGIIDNDILFIIALFFLTCCRK